MKYYMLVIEQPDVIKRQIYIGFYILRRLQGFYTSAFLTLYIVFFSFTSPKLDVYLTIYVGLIPDVKNGYFICRPSIRRSLPDVYGLFNRRKKAI